MYMNVDTQQGNNLASDFLVYNFRQFRNFGGGSLININVIENGNAMGIKPKFFSFKLM